jgi:hypothetical protein
MLSFVATCFSLVAMYVGLYVGLLVDKVRRGHSFLRLFKFSSASHLSFSSLHSPITIHEVCDNLGRCCFSTAPTLEFINESIFCCILKIRTW